MTITVPVRKVTKDLTATLVISGMRTFNARVWLALLVLRVAA